MKHRCNNKQPGKLWKKTQGYNSSRIKFQVSTSLGSYQDGRIRQRGKRSTLFEVLVLKTAVCDLEGIGHEQLILWNMTASDMEELKHQVKQETLHKKKENIMPLVMQMSKDQIETAYQGIIKQWNISNWYVSESCSDLDHASDSESEQSELQLNNNNLSEDKQTIDEKKKPGYSEIVSNNRSLQLSCELLQDQDFSQDLLPENSKSCTESCSTETSFDCIRIDNEKLQNETKDSSTTVVFDDLQFVPSDAPVDNEETISEENASQFQITKDSTMPATDDNLTTEQMTVKPFRFETLVPSELIGNDLEASSQNIQAEDLGKTVECSTSASCVVSSVSAVVLDNLPFIDIKSKNMNTVVSLNDSELMPLIDSHNPKNSGKSSNFRVSSNEINSSTGKRETGKLKKLDTSDLCTMSSQLFKTADQNGTFEMECDSAEIDISDLKELNGTILNLENVETDMLEMSSSEAYSNANEKWTGLWSQDQCNLAKTSGSSLAEDKTEEKALCISLGSGTDDIQKQNSNFVKDSATGVSELESCKNKFLSFQGHRNGCIASTSETKSSEQTRPGVCKYLEESSVKKGLRKKPLGNPDDLSDPNLKGFSENHDSVKEKHSLSDLENKNIVMNLDNTDMPLKLGNNDKIWKSSVVNSHLDKIHLTADSSKQETDMECESKKSELEAKLVSKSVPYKKIRLSDVDLFSHEKLKLQPLTSFKSDKVLQRLCFKHKKSDKQSELQEKAVKHDVSNRKSELAKVTEISRNSTKVNGNCIEKKGFVSAVESTQKQVHACQNIGRKIETVQCKNSGSLQVDIGQKNSNSEYHHAVKESSQNQDYAEVLQFSDLKEIPVFIEADVLSQSGNSKHGENEAESSFNTRSSLSQLQDCESKKSEKEILAKQETYMLCNDRVKNFSTTKTDSLTYHKEGKKAVEVQLLHQHNPFHSRKCSKTEEKLASENGLNVNHKRLHSKKVKLDLGCAVVDNNTAVLQNEISFKRHEGDKSLVLPDVGCQESLNKCIAEPFATEVTVAPNATNLLDSLNVLANISDNPFNSNIKCLVGELSTCPGEEKGVIASSTDTKNSRKTDLNVAKHLGNEQFKSQALQNVFVNSNSELSSSASSTETGLKMLCCQTSLAVGDDFLPSGHEFSCSFIDSDMSDFKKDGCKARELTVRTDSYCDPSFTSSCNGKLPDCNNLQHPKVVQNNIDSNNEGISPIHSPSCSSSNCVEDDPGACLNSESLPMQSPIAIPLSVADPAVQTLLEQLHAVQMLSITENESSLES